MRKISEWKLAEKLQASNRRGVIIGICIAVLIIVAVVVVVAKINWLKKTFGCCDCDDFDEYHLDDDDLDESGYANDKDFV